MLYDDEYERILARTYDPVYGIVRDPSGDVAFYVEQAKDSGGPVLELGCGTGRVLIPTARLGLSCVGLDASAEMLAVLREKNPPENLELVNGRMEAFDLGERRFRLDHLAFELLRRRSASPVGLGELPALRTVKTAMGSQLVARQRRPRVRQGNFIDDVGLPASLRS